MTFGWPIDLGFWLKFMSFESKGHVFRGICSWKSIGIKCFGWPNDLNRGNSDEILDGNRGSDPNFSSGSQKNQEIAVLDRLEAIRIDFDGRTTWVFQSKGTGLAIQGLINMSRGRWPNDLEGFFKPRGGSRIEISWNCFRWPNDLGFSIEKGGTYLWKSTT